VETITDSQLRESPPLACGLSGAPDVRAEKCGALLEILAVAYVVEELLSIQWERI